MKPWPKRPWRNVRMLRINFWDMELPTFDIHIILLGWKRLPTRNMNAKAQPEWFSTAAETRIVNIYTGLAHWRPQRTIPIQKGWNVDRKSPGNGRHVKTGWDFFITGRKIRQFFSSFGNRRPQGQSKLKHYETMTLVLTVRKRLPGHWTSTWYLFIFA